MKIRLTPLTSDILISIYVIVSLYLRFKFESQTPIAPINSIVIGASFVLIIWVFIKLKVLNPNWFGFFNTQKKKIKTKSSSLNKN